MQWTYLLVWICTGILIGILSGFMGVGGGIALTPILLYLGMSPAQATATSLAFIIPTAWAGIMKSRDDVDVNLSVLLAIGAVIGTYAIGRPLVDKVNPAIYKKVFGVFLLLVALNMITGITERIRDRSRPSTNSDGMHRG